MKLAVILLVVLGLVAAGATVVFVESLSLFQPKAPERFDVLVAAQDLEPRTPLTETQVEVIKMPLTGVAQGHLSTWNQAAGRILKVAVVKGQPLTNSQLIPKGSIDELLRPGMLAFPAPLPKRTTDVGLLYPGCIVDVFATFPLTNREKGEAVVTPLLQMIQVLAIADDTVIPPANEKEAAAAMTRKSSSSGSGGNVTVTLEVSARQMAALQLALEKGTLGLAMRNPTDKALNPMEPMVVKEGTLTAASEALDPQTLALVSSLRQMLNPQSAPDPNAPKPVATPPVATPAPVTVPVPVAPAIAAPIPGVTPRNSMWQMTVIRGQKVEEAEVQLGEDAEGKETPEEQETVQEGK